MKITTNRVLTGGVEKVTLPTTTNLRFVGWNRAFGEGSDREGPCRSRSDEGL